MDDYDFFKKQVTDDLEKNQSSLKSRLGNQVGGEQASIANIINQRKKNEYRVIDQLESSSVVETTEKEKEKIIYNYFKNIYKLEKKPSSSSIYDSVPPVEVDNTDARCLTIGLLTIEILTAINELKIRKFPGLDGIPKEF